MGMQLLAIKSTTYSVYGGDVSLDLNHGSKKLLEIRDSQNLAKLGQECTTKLSDGGGEGIEFWFNWRCGWISHNGPELGV